jgi:hypothetical protein
MFHDGFVSGIDQVSDFRSSFGKEPYMRLLALLPELWVSARPAAQVAAIALCVGGCSTLDGASGISSQLRYAGPAYLSAGRVYADPSKRYLMDIRTVELQREFLDRYACAAEVPLVCQCVGRISQTCECHC